MTYAQYGNILAADYNSLVGNAAVTNSLNKVYATGTAGFGYGQTAVPTVTAGNQIGSTEWANLITKTASVASHQGTSLSTVTTPTTGSLIAYQANVVTNLSSINTNKWNAIAQGTTSANAVTRSTTWQNSLLFTHTVTFASGDAARYFFNSGGQLKISVAHNNTSSTPNTVMRDLCLDVGTVVLSAPNSGTATIVGTSYNGVTQVGAASPTDVPVYNTNNGYYALSSANASLITVSTDNNATYTASLINITAKTNGTQGANGDTGSVITIYTTWDINPNIATTLAAGVSTTTVVAFYPSTTYLSNTWGTLTLAGSVSGS